MKMTIRDWLKAYYGDGKPVIGDVYLNHVAVSSFSTAQVRGTVEVYWRGGGSDIFDLNKEIEIIPTLDTARDLVARLLERRSVQTDDLSTEARQFIEDIDKHYPF